MGYGDRRSLAVTYLLQERAVKEIERDQLETESGHGGTGMRIRTCGSSVPSPSSRSRRVFARVRAVLARYRFSPSTHRCAPACII